MKKLPEYLKEESFNQKNLQDLLQEGQLQNKIDSFNTISFSTDDIDESSALEDFLLLIPTEKRRPIPPQVETYIPTQVTDYEQDIATNPDEEVSVVDELDDVTQEMENMLTSEQALQAQIDELSNRLDEEIGNSVKLKEDATETFSAAKDIIISQRIAAGEGNAPDEFSNVFPFLPKTAEEKQNEGVDPAPFMGGYL